MDIEGADKTKGNESLSARKRQKLDENSGRKDWYGGSRNLSGGNMHKNKHTQHASGGYRDNYQNGDGSTNSTDNHSYERNRRSYDRDYSAYGSDSTNWKQRGSSWYEDFPTSASGGGYESTAWSGDGRYREYPVHEDSYSASSSGFYRSNSGKLDGSYGYDGYYRSISADLGGSYTNERSTSVPSSSSNAYYGADAYSSTRYDYSGYNAHYEGQGYGTDGRCADKFGRTGKYGFSSAYRAGTTTTTASTSAAGGRYANTFKTKQYSFGNKRNNRNKVGGAATGESNGCSVTPKEGEAQEEQKEPEKPKIIDDVKVKDFLALRSTVLDYHLTMALLKLNLKPDLDLRKTLQDAKCAEAGLYIAPEVSKEAVLEVVTAPASAATAAAVYSAMPAPEQLARVNSVEVKQKQPIQGTMLSRAESAGPGVLKKEVSGVKRQNTWSNFAPSKDADTASVSSALSESKSEYGFNRVGRDVYPAQPDTAARSLFDSYDSSARKPPPHSRDTSTSYPFPATAAESTMPRPVLDAPRGDARQASRDRSSARSRSRSRISLPPSATSGPAVAYSRGDSFSSAAPYAGRDSKDSRDRQAPRSRSRDNVHRGHSRDGRDGNRDVSRIVNNRDSYDYPAGSYYDYNNNSYPSPAGSDRYPDNRYGYDAYGYDGYDDRGYGAYPAYDRYDAYGPQQGRADYEYGETRNAYGNSAQQSSSSVGGRYRDDRQASSWRNGARAEGQGLVRQGSAGSLTSRRSRSRSPPPPSHAQAGGAGGVETAGNPVRGAHSVERGGRRVVERSASRQGAQQPGLVRNNSNFRGTANNAQNTSACTSNISPPAASATGAAAAAPIATAVATAAATTAPISPRAATPLQEEREPGESTPISSPEAPAAGKRFNREVILAKQNHQPTFNNGYGGKGDFSGNLGGGSGSGFKGKQGQFSSQYQGGGAYGQNQGQQQQQVHYGSHQGGQQGQQGGHMLNKQQQNKFQKGGYSGPPQQAQVQPSGALSQMAGGSGGLRPSPGKKAQTGGAPVVITTEVAPLKTPR